MSQTRSLHAAIDAYDLAGLVAAIHAGADLEARNAHGYTPLHCVVVPFGGWLEGVKALLAAGADPRRARAANGMTVTELLHSGVSSASEAMQAQEIERLLREATG